MNIKQLSSRLTFYSLFYLCCTHEVFADIIYQWSDPWGQVKYSKTQVPGSMVSDLTELPESQESTEQQKQEAMVQKMREMKQANTLHKQKKAAQRFFKKQNKINANHCRKLRNMLADVELRNSRKSYLDNHYIQGRPYFPGRYNYYPDYSYDFLENDLYWEIREHCR